jgi:WD40 repeat protein
MAFDFVSPSHRSFARVGQLRRGAALVALLLAGCGGNTASPAAPATGPSSDSTDRVASNAESDPAKPREKGEKVPRYSGVPRTEVATDAPEAAPGFDVGRARVRPITAPIWDDALPTEAIVAASAKYERWTLKKSISVGFSHLSIADLSVDETRLLALSESEAKARIYEFPNGKLLGKSEIPGYARFETGDFGFWPGDSAGSRFWYVGPKGISLHDSLSGAEVAHLSDRPSFEAHWTRDRRLFGVVSSQIPAQTSELMLFRLEDDKLEPALSLTFKERVEAWALTRDRKRLVVSYYPSGETEFLDLEKRTLIWKISAPEYTNSLVLSPDETRAAVGGARVELFAMAEPERRSTYSKLGNNVHQIQFSPSGDAIAVSAYDGHVRILANDLAEPELKLLKDLRHAGTANVYALRFTRDGKRLVSSSGDQSVRVWGE